MMNGALSGATEQAMGAFSRHPGTSVPEGAEVPMEAVFPVRRFSVAEYEQIGRAGILTEDDSVELLEGLIVEKMTKYPPHDAMIDLLVQLLQRQLPLAWYP